MDFAKVRLCYKNGSGTKLLMKYENVKENFSTYMLDNVNREEIDDLLVSLKIITIFCNACNVTVLHAINLQMKIVKDSNILSNEIKTILNKNVEDNYWY